MNSFPLKSNGYPPALLSWWVWGLGAVFYCYGFFQRVAPGVLTDQLMADFQMGATALGNLSAFYFYSYVAMQIPTGILADFWGPRKLLTTGAIVAGLGSIIFALAPTPLFANMGRLLIGGAVAVAWVVMLKLATHWFAPNRFAMITGLALFCGVIGAVCAGVPLRMLADNFGWRPVMTVSGAFTLGISVAIWIVVRDDPSEKGFKSYARIKHMKQNIRGKAISEGLKSVFRHKNILLLTLAPGGIVGPVLAFAGLWGVPFFTTHYHFSASLSAALLSAVSGICNMGIMMGPMLLQPAMGWILDRHWIGLMENGIRIYELEAYRWAFTLMLGWAVISCISLMLTRETACRQMT